MGLQFHMQRKRLQRDLYFNQLIRSNSFDISFYLFPEDRVSGDFFGIYELDSENIGILIGDVSGKGINSMIIAAIFKSIVSRNIKSVHDPGELLSRVNNDICGILPGGSFVAAGFYRLNTRRHIIDYSVAGIPNYYLRSLDREAVPLFNKGARLVLGVKKDLKYRTQILEMRRGEILLIHTDGLTEAKSKKGRRYGQERLNSIIQKYRYRESDFIINRIMEDLDNFLSNSVLKDDMLIFLIKANNPDIKSFLMPGKESDMVVQWRMLVILFLKTVIPMKSFSDALLQYKAEIEQFGSDIFIIHIGSSNVYEDIISRGLDLALYFRDILRVNDNGFNLGINVKRVPLTSKGSLDWSIALDGVSSAIHQASLKESAIIANQSIYNLSKDLFYFNTLSLPEGDKYFELLSRRPFDAIDMELINRKEELAYIKKLNRQKLKEGTYIICIKGETGSGKTPMILNFQNILKKNGFLCMINTCSSFTEDIPFYIWLDSLKMLLNIDAGSETGKSSQIRELKKYLMSIRIYSDDILNTILYKFGLSDVKPKGINGIFSDFIIKYMEYLSYKRPLCFIFEDIDHMNHESFNTVRGIIEKDIPVLMILSYKKIRPEFAEYFKHIKEHSQFHCIDLMPLKKNAVKSYLKEKLLNFNIDSNPINRLSNKIYDITQGNHLFITEITALMIRELRRGLDINEFLKDPSRLISNNVQAIIESRILKLPASLLKILQTASVYGGRFSLDFLLFVLRDSFARDELVKGIDILSKEGIIYLYQQPDVYIFKNMLYKEIIYIGLLEEDKIRLHYLAGEYIISLIEDSKKLYNPLRLKMLASKHLERAMQIKQSLIIMLDIIKDLKKSFSYNDAVKLINKALVMLERLDDENLLFDLIYELAYISLYTGKIDAGKQQIDRLIELYIKSNNILQYYKINVIKGYYHNIRGEYLKGLRLMERLDLEVLRSKYADIYIEGNILKAKLLSRIGYANRAMEIYNDLQNYIPDSVYYNMLLLEGLCDSSLFKGNYQKTINYANKLLGILKETGNTIADSRVMYYLARAYIEIGNLTLSRKYIKDNAVFNKRIDYQEGKAWNYHLLFMHFVAKGNLNAALNEIERAYQIFSDLDHKYGLSVLQYNLANFYTQLGYYKKAEEYVKMGIRNAKRVKAAGILFSNLIAGSQLYCLLKDDNRVKTMFDALMSIFWVAESKFYRYKALLSRSLFYRTRGDNKSLENSVRVLKNAEKQLIEIHSKLYRYIILGEKVRTYNMLSDYDSGYNIVLQLDNYWEDLYRYPSSEHYLASAINICARKNDKNTCIRLKDYFDSLLVKRRKEAGRLGIAEMYEDIIRDSVMLLKNIE